MKIGILGAMSIEINSLCEKLERTIIKNIAGSEYFIGQLNGISVVVVKCGIGKVNSAICTQVMIDHFDIDLIINTGIAGSLKNELNIGDIVISKDLVQHDFDTTGAGDELGLITGFSKVTFDVEEKLYNVAYEVGQEIFGKEKVFLGRIGTGDQFVCDKSKKEKIVKNFGAICVEMEGCAIAQACFLNNMPFLAVRSISDKADESATIDFHEFEVMAAKNSSTLIEQLITKLQVVEL